MKPKLSLLFLVSCVVCLLTLCSAPSALSQVPQGFNYQAIVRDGTTKQPVISDDIIVRITIENAAETAVYQETHSLETDEFGIIAIVIGEGTPAGTDLFGEIDWNKEQLYLKTELKYPVTNPDFTGMGTAPLQSVPYAMVADSLSRPLTKLSVKGETSDMEEALFEVRNKDGQTVFAVYNEGVRVYVSDGDKKGPKGGFAIGGFGTDKGTSQPYFIVKPDTIRVYINKTGKGPKGGFAIGGYGTDKADIQDFLFISDDSVRIYIDNADDDIPKGVKGGFAIGGYGTAKGKPQDLFMVSNDSVRVYIDKAETDKGPKGGFAIGGYGTTKAEDEEYLRVTRDSTRVYINESSKISTGGFAINGIGAVPGTITPFTSLTPDNYLIGHRSGKGMTTGEFNSFIGYETGMENDTGSYNTILGYQSGYKNKSDFNVFLGYKSGYNNVAGKSNTFLGHMAGYLNSSGDNNVAIGSLAGYYLSAVSHSNVLIGDSAGYGSTGIPSLRKNSFNVIIGKGAGKSNIGDYNAFLGYQTGMKNIDGSSNVFIGNQSGFSNTGGNYNVFMGNLAGFSNNSSYNTFLGYQAGKNYTTGSYNTFIGYRAGMASETFFGTGNSNVILGYNAGLNLTSGYDNVFIGTSSGKLTTSGFENTFIGKEAGYNVTSGNSNVAIGFKAGRSITSNDFNTLVGENAGYSLSSGSKNVFFGNFTGYYTSSGNNNTMVGYEAGNFNRSGSYNTFIGYEAAGAISEAGQGVGSYSVFLGYQAGYSELESNRLYIENSQAGKYGALIYGEFDNDILVFNADVGINTTTPDYDVWIQGGSVSGSGYTDNRNLAMLGYDEYSGDRLVINYKSEYAGGTEIGGPLKFTDTYDRVITDQRYMVININGEVGGYSSSSIRYKENVFDLKDFDWLYDLRPVIYNYKNTSVADLQYGLIAEEVSVVNPLIVVYDKENRPDGLLYERLTVPMLKAIQDQKEEIDSLKETVKNLEALVHQLIEEK